MADEIRRQERQDVIKASMRFFIGRETNRIYHVVQCEYEYQPGIWRKLWRVFLLTKDGFVLVEGKEAAMDCGSGLLQADKTHLHWELLWDRAD